jgi:hypothetical protein
MPLFRQWDRCQGLDEVAPGRPPAIGPNRLPHSCIALHACRRFRLFYAGLGKVVGESFDEAL